LKSLEIKTFRHRKKAADFLSKSTTLFGGEVLFLSELHSGKARIVIPKNGILSAKLKAQV